MAIPCRNNVLRAGKARCTETRHLRRLAQIKSSGFAGTTLHAGHYGIHDHVIAGLNMVNIATHLSNAGGDFMPGYHGRSCKGVPTFQYMQIGAANAIKHWRNADFVRLKFLVWLINVFSGDFA
jgi:hypothetical protein